MKYVEKLDSLFFKENEELMLQKYVGFVQEKTNIVNYKYKKLIFVQKFFIM